MPHPRTAYDNDIPYKGSKAGKEHQFVMLKLRNETVQYLVELEEQFNLIDYEIVDIAVKAYYNHWNALQDDSTP